MIPPDDLRPSRTVQEAILEAILLAQDIAAALLLARELELYGRAGRAAQHLATAQLALEELIEIAPALGFGPKVVPLHPSGARPGPVAPTGEAMNGEFEGRSLSELEAMRDKGRRLLGALALADLANKRVNAHHKPYAPDGFGQLERNFVQLVSLRTALARIESAIASANPQGGPP